jgi:hypothetical protein
VNRGISAGLIRSGVEKSHIDVAGIQKFQAVFQVGGNVDLPTLEAKKGFQALSGFRGIQDKNSRHIGHGRLEIPKTTVLWYVLTTSCGDLNIPAFKTNQEYIPTRA